MDPLNVVDEDQPNKKQRLCSTNDDIDGKSNANDIDNNNHRVPIRTVYVGGGGKDKVHEVKGHFERFGEVESVTMLIKGYCKRRYLVQFKREEDAAKALQCTEKPWHNFEAKPADPWHQPDHPLNKPPDAESNIVCVLNDDCVQEIFRRLKLLADLTNVAEVCVRFNQQAKLTFASQHEHLDLHHEFSHREGLVETAMDHFGKHIRSLSTRSGLFKTEAIAIDIIARCCGPKLKRLELNGFGFQNDLQALRPIFAGIEQLKLCDCDDSFGLGELVAGCVELKSLKLDGCGDFKFKTNPYLTKQTFPKLEKFSLDRTVLNEKIFKRFITRHPALTKLSNTSSISSYAFRVSGKYAKNLQELKFDSCFSEYDDQFRKNAAFIGQLMSLKKIKLDTESHEIVPVLNALIAGEVPIEILAIWFRGELDHGDAMKCIWELKQIKTLRLTSYCNLNYVDYNPNYVDYRYVTDEDVIGLVKNLPELEELDVDEYLKGSELSTIGLRKMLVHATKLKMLKLRRIESIKIDVDDYKAMLSTIQQRKEKVPLVIEICYGEADQVDVPATVLAENRKTLDVRMIRSI